MSHAITPHSSRLALSALVLIGAGCSDGTAPEAEFPEPRPFTPDTEGLRPFPEFPDNPLTREGVALGRRLFHDPILSLDHTQSCATCHDQALAFSDARQFSEGVAGSLGTRNAPAIVNAAWQKDFFWAGRVLKPEPIPINVTQI